MWHIEKLLRVTVKLAINVIPTQTSVVIAEVIIWKTKYKFRY